MRPSEDAGDGRTQLRAPIPGLVVAVRVKVGHQVEKNQSVAALAAKKL
ncbi:MAG: hypothetical protein HYZ53_13780 [Planctomycetes bacterium]|nr:hypothetical protein [Planctomycetota bacterium]